MPFDKLLYTRDNWGLLDFHIGLVLSTAKLNPQIRTQLTDQEILSIPMLRWSKSL